MWFSNILLCRASLSRSNRLHTLNSYLHHIKWVMTWKGSCLKAFTFWWQKVERASPAHSNCHWHNRYYWYSVVFRVYSILLFVADWTVKLPKLDLVFTSNLSSKSTGLSTKPIKKHFFLPCYYVVCQSCTMFHW